MKCLVTSIGSMSAEAVIQTIIGKPGRTVVGCNMYPKEWTPASRLLDRFHQVPSARDAAAYLRDMVGICRAEQISHVIPLTDPEVDLLSAEQRRFDELGVALCISPPEAVSMARDKLSIYQRFVDHPRVRPIPTKDLQENGVINFSFPLLAKPRHGRSSEGQVAIPDAAALEFWRSRLSGQEYVLQPRYTGEVFVVDVVRQPGSDRAVAMTRQELLRTSNGAGMTVRMQPQHACDTLAFEAAEVLGLRGCVNLEFLVVDGMPLLMDVNPRFSAGVAFSLMSGYDMVSNHLRCFSNKLIEACMPPPNKLYARGLVEYSILD